MIEQDLIKETTETKVKRWFKDKIDVLRQQLFTKNYDTVEDRSFYWRAKFKCCVRIQHDKLEIESLGKNKYFLYEFTINLF